MALRSSPSQVLRLVRAAAGACVALSTLAISAAPADAHYWRHFHRHFHYAASRQGAPSDPAFAAIVVDANTGRTLYAVSENELRHPASITKVMTLYLLFEQLDKGALTLQSRNSDLRARRRARTLQARGPARRHDFRRRRDQGDRHPFGQRCRGRHRGEDRRRREHVRRNDDPQGARPGHVAHRSMSMRPACLTTGSSPPRAT